MNKIFDEIRTALIREWRDGATQQQMADRANLTNAYINNLLSGKRKVETMKLETLFKLFPNAAINLNGAQIAGDNAMQVQMTEVGDFERSAAKILDDETLSAEEKVKFLRVLKK